MLRHAFLFVTLSFLSSFAFGQLVAPSQASDSYTVDWSAVATYQPAFGGTYSAWLKETWPSGAVSTKSVSETETSRTFLDKPVGTYSYVLEQGECVQFPDENSTTGEWIEECFYFDVSNQVFVDVIPSVPTVTAPLTNLTGNYTVSMSTAGIVDYYELQEQIDGGGFGDGGNNNAASASYQKTTDATYGYRARACNNGCSAWSAVQNIQVLRTPSTPGSISAPSTSAGSHTVSWGTSSGTVDSYDVQRRLNGGSWSSIQNSIGTSINESNLADGSYEYRVQACNALSCSAFNAVTSVQVANVSGTPGSISGQSFSTTGNYTLFWGAASGTVSHYNLERRTGAGSWSSRQSGNSLFLDETGLASNTYEYRVQACNNSACSGWTAIHTIDVVLAPGIPSAINVSPTTSTDGNFTITWAASSGISSFHEVDRQDNGGAWTNIASKSSSPWTYTDTGLNNGVYTYRARACHTLGSTTNCSTYATATPSFVSIASSSAPTLSISQPASGSQFVAGDPVLFLVSASDTNDGDLSASVQWSSNLDGVLGTGDGLIVSSLSVGTHSITTSVANSSGLSTSVNTSLTVVSAGSGSGSREVFNGTFDSTGDTQGFVYLDDVFRNSASPSYASGNHRVDSSCDNGGCLYVELAGIDGNNIDHMSGAWQKSFTLSSGESASITFRYFIDQGSNYESNEFSEAIFSVDGVQIGTLGNDYLFHVAGDGEGGIALSTNGWITETFDLGELGAGSHIIEIGAYNNRKTASSEFTSMWIDDVVLTADGGSSTPQAPTVSITQPLAGSQITVGSSVSFSVSASDAIDGDISANVQWASDIDGVFGTGGGFTVNSLSVGAHNITASVLNSSGLSTVATTSLTVTSSGSGSGSGSQVLFSGTFDSAGDTQGFVYQGDAFRNTANPSYASGTHRVDSSCDNVGCLYLELGGIDSNTVLGMSAGWQKNFTLVAGEAASISLRYSLNQGSEFESDEFSEAIIAIDGVQIGTLGNDYLFHVAGDGGGGAVVGTNGWITETLNLGVLGAGNHTISIGSYNNKKTYTNEITSMWIDDVVLTTTGSGSTANTAPTINIAAPSNASSVTQGQNVAFAASANDAEDGDLSALIQWSSNLDGNLGAGGIINIANLSVGTHQVTATITDMAGAVTSDVVTITITSAGSGSGSGSREVFNGTFNSSGDAQGFVYLDDVFRNSASPNYASGGQLVDSSCDNGGCLYVELAGIDANNIDHMSGAWQKSFTLSAGESASITFRYFFDQGSNYESNEFSEAIFSVDGVQIGTQGNDYLFHVAGDGEGGIALSTNGWITETFDLGELGAGSHIIEIGAYNNRKTASSEFTSMWIDDVVLTATGGATNSSPTINILTPTGSSSFPQGQTVVFSAIANDTEDGDSSSSIQWNSNLDGNLGSGGLIYISNLSIGVHQVTASITDLDGATSSEQVTVSITIAANNAPNVSISSPSDGTNLSQGSTATFTASANDVEDGDLSASVQWSSSINGLLGSGSSLSTNFLSIGSHTITASVIDSFGATDSQQVNITVSDNTPSPTGAISFSNPDNDGTFGLSWEASPGAVDSYELQRKTASGNWTTIQNNSVAIRFEDGLALENYSYRVRACNAGVCSSWSTTIIVQVLVASPPSNIVGSAEPGTIPLSTRVSARGELAINIPINAPIGVNGLQPSLNLSYKDQRLVADDAIQSTIGYGWQLTGFTSIRRCSADDTPVRYCMGQSALFQKPNLEFSLNTDLTVNIVKNQTAGVTWFEMFSGARVYRFGQDLNSQSTANIETWFLSEVEDAFGNILNISYVPDQSNGHIYPSTMEYDGSVIDFNYASRPLPSGSTEQHANHAAVELNTIKLFADNVQSGEYRLNYQTQNNLRVLVDIQYCGFDQQGNTPLCLPATHFNWFAPPSPENKFRAGVEEIIDGLGATSAVQREKSNHTDLSSFNPLFFGVGDYLAFFTDAEMGFANFEERTFFPFDEEIINGQFWFVARINRSTEAGLDNITAYKYEYDQIVGRFSKLALLPDGTSIFSYSLLNVGYFGGRANSEMYSAHYQGEFGQPGSNLISERHNHFKKNHLINKNAHWVPSRTVDVIVDEESGARIGATITDREYDWDDTNFVFNSMITTTKTGHGFSVVVEESPFIPGTFINAGTIDIDNVQRITRNTNNYSNDLVNRRLGFIDHKTLEIFGDPNDPGTDIIESTHQQLGNTLRSESDTAFPNLTELSVTTNQNYDTSGNLLSGTISGNNFQTRDSSIGGYIDQRYPGSTTNAKGHTTYFTNYDKRFGTPQQIIGPNGQQATVLRDQLGRIIHAESNGVVASSQTLRCDSSCPSVPGISGLIFPAFKTTTTFSHSLEIFKGAPDTITYFDQLGRVVRQESEGFIGGQWIKVDTVYNHIGQVEKVSLPYITGSPEYREFQYDIKGRVILSTNPDGSSTLKEYLQNADQYQIITTQNIVRGPNTKTQKHFEEYNILGQLIKTIDGLVDSNFIPSCSSGTAGNDEVITEYDYDRMGNNTSVRINCDSNTTVSKGYDKAGRVVSLVDPNVGNVDFTFDALGQLTQQNNLSRFVLTDFGYDILGRLVERIDDSGSALGTSPIVNTWVYDSAPNGIGQLSSRSNPGFQENYFYNNLSQLESVSSAISVGGFSANYASSFTYDSYGRSKTISYPSGLTVFNNYNSRGYAVELYRDNVAGQLLSRTDTVDHFGNTTQSTLGNGLVTNRIFNDLNGQIESIVTGSGQIQDNNYEWWSNGTLHQRGSMVAGNTLASEVFTYDNLNRLTSTNTASSFGARSLDYSYDALGNLLSKTDSAAANTIDNYNYAGDNKPHRLNSVDVNGLTHIYNYDGGGNLEFDDASGTDNDRTISYNGFGKPLKITKGDTNNPLAENEFKYGPDGSRFYKENLQGDKTIYLFDGVVEINLPASGNIQSIEKTSLGSAVHFREVDFLNNVSERLQYIHTDHLGSVTVITDENANPVQQKNFDPFGAYRNESWSGRASAPTELEQFLNTSRGYTGHEQLDDVGLIHMNGRVYDPEVGRFVSADPLVQAPTFSQSYNRYAYVFNNPMGNTDPSGYCGVIAGNPCPVLDDFGNVWEYVGSGEGGGEYATGGYVEQYTEWGGELLDQPTTYGKVIRWPSGVSFRSLDFPMAQKVIERTVYNESIPISEKDGYLADALSLLEKRLSDSSRFTSPEIQSQYIELYKKVDFKIVNVDLDGYQGLTKYGSYLTRLYNDGFIREYIPQSNGKRRYEPRSRTVRILATLLAHELRHSTLYNYSLGTKATRLRAHIDDTYYAPFERDADKFANRLISRQSSRLIGEF